MPNNTTVPGVSWKSFLSDVWTSKMTIDMLKSIYMMMVIVSLILLICMIDSIIKRFCRMIIMTVKHFEPSQTFTTPCDFLFGVLSSFMFQRKLNLKNERDEVLWEVYRMCYMVNFFLINIFVFISITFLVCLYELDYILTLYTIASAAILISIFGGTIYVPYIEGFKTVVGRSVQYGRTYDLMKDNRTIYGHVMLHRISAFHLTWKCEDGAVFSMVTSRIKTFDVKNVER